ncbi:MAG: D-glycero-beta-D-manno-heptose-7-phosphate kinase, partial [Chlorobiaceae bacterium]|nr:D-glycero-beta-D-manno-heptose-7-phosphate kinase [Chlorobiaceae bacterium]
IGVTGADADREILADLCQNLHLSVDFLVPDASRPTTSKTRILSQSHHITRVDYESKKDVDQDIENAVLERFQHIADNIDAVILEDYNKGLLTESIVQNVIRIAEKNNTPVLVDPKLKGFFSYQNCSVFKPNLSEMASSLGIVLHNNDREIEDACMLLQEKLNARAVVVTRSEKGMTIYNGKFTHIPATSLEVSDVSGAGDTVISVLALGSAAGLDIETSAAIANLAAGSVCQEVGAVPVKPDKLLRACQEYLR